MLAGFRFSARFPPTHPRDGPIRRAIVKHRMGLARRTSRPGQRVRRPSSRSDTSFSVRAEIGSLASGTFTPLPALSRDPSSAAWSIRNPSASGPTRTISPLIRPSSRNTFSPSRAQSKISGRVQPMEGRRPDYPPERANNPSSARECHQRAERAAARIGGVRRRVLDRQRP